METTSSNLPGKSLGEEAQQVSRQESMVREQSASLQRLADNRLRYLLAAVAVFVLVLAGVTIWGFGESRSAQANAQSAVLSQATAQAAESAQQTSMQSSQDNLAYASALRLAAEANSLSLTHGDTNLIGLLSIRSLNMHYSPYADTVLGGLTSLGAPPRDLIGHTNAVQAIAFSPDGKYVATSSDDKTARLWDAATGKPLRTFVGHTDGVQGITYSIDGRYIFTTSRDRTVRLGSGT